MVCLCMLLQGNALMGGVFSKWQMNPYDRGSAFAIGSDGLLCQSREFKDWHGCRTTKGVIKGKYYYEV